MEIGLLSHRVVGLQVCVNMLIWFLGFLDSGLIFVLNKTYVTKTVMHTDDYDSLWSRDMRRYELV